MLKFVSMFFTLFVFVLFVNYGVCKVINDVECHNDSDCDMELAVCEKSMCVCPPGFVENSDMTKCLQGANGYGAVCEDSLQCSYSLKSGGYCSDKTCKCNEKFHYLRGKCWRTSGLGEKCSNDENCYVSHDFESSTCNTTTKLCECSVGYYQREYSSCRRISGPGEPCGIALDCKNCDNAVCTKDRICNCSKAQFIIPRNSNKVEDLMVKKFSRSMGAVVGDNCTKDENCASINNSYCGLDRKCQCKTGFYTTDNSSCHPELGSHCESHDECIGKNMMCRKEKSWCTCKAGFVAADGNQFCEKMSRNISWSCLKTEECSFFGPEGICVKKKCACSPTSHFVVDQLYCWNIKKVGEDCKQDLDCGRDSRVESCTDGKCKCQKGYHSADGGNECRQDSTKLGDPCIDNSDCIFDHAVCSSNNTCQCVIHFIPQNGVCVPGIGSNCNKDGDCTIKDSACKNGVCQCKEGLVTSHDWSTCLHVATKYKDPCKEVEQCAKLLGDGAACDNDTCVCASGYHYLEGHPCFRNRNITQACSFNSECVAPNSYCSKGNCTCNYNHVPDIINNICIRSGNGGSSLKYSGILLIVLILSLELRGNIH